MRRALYWVALIANVIAAAYGTVVFTAVIRQPPRTGSDWVYFVWWGVLPLVTVAALIWPPRRGQRL